MMPADPQAHAAAVGGAHGGRESHSLRVNARILAFRNRKRGYAPNYMVGRPGLEPGTT